MTKEMPSEMKAGLNQCIKYVESSSTTVPKLLKSPVLMTSMFNDWCDVPDWTFKSLADLLKNQKFSCRISPKSCERRMETECRYEEVTLAQFQAWLESKVSEGNPLFPNDRNTHSAYIDYKYMKDMFVDHPDVFAKVQWSTFGLGEFDGHDSTIWLGSEGANTPGHQDSYGFNVVTQIYGRKLWILFPPEDSPCLYPTRVPYEESSVFSDVNIRNPDVTKHPLMKASHPYIVVLHPGESLYVPHHWWHYVESLEPSISINVWVPLANDAESRLHEAVTRCLASSLISDMKTLAEDGNENRWLNPTETLFSSDLNVGLLRCAVRSVLDKNHQGATFTENQSCVGQDKEDKNRHLLSFYQTIQGYPLTHAQCPYGFVGQSSARKRKFIVSDCCQSSKVCKLNSDICGSSKTMTSRTEDQNIDVSPSVHSSHTGAENSLPEISTFTNCSFTEYVSFMEKVCQLHSCSNCVQRKQKSRGENMPRTNHIDSEREQDVHCREDVSTICETEIKYDLGVKFSKSSSIGNRPEPETDLSVWDASNERDGTKTPPANNPNTKNAQIRHQFFSHSSTENMENKLSLRKFENCGDNSEKHSVSSCHHSAGVSCCDDSPSVSRNTDNEQKFPCMDDLSSADMADCLLSSVLDPTVVCQIAEIFQMKCKQKFKFAV